MAETAEGPEMLLARARSGDAAILGRLLASYRNYLRLMADTQMGPALRSRVEPSDLVQEALLEAHRDFGEFQGGHEGELLAWLRRILAHNLYNQARHFAAQQGDAAREVSLEQVQAGVERSSLALGRCLADVGETPSQAAVQREAALRLADALARLPADYQTVLLLRVYEEMPAEEVAQHMGRTAGAVRMLQMRALAALREHLAAE